MKKSILAAMLFASIGSAQAQVTGNLTAATDYRFRGISQTQNSQAFQGGIDYTHASGFYAGNWNSNVSNKVYTDSNGLESDVYAGFKKEVVKGVTVDVGSYNYIYSRSTNRFGSNSNTNEVFGAVTTGPVTLKYSQSLGDYFGAVGEFSDTFGIKNLLVILAGSTRSVRGTGDAWDFLNNNPDVAEKYATATGFLLLRSCIRIVTASQGKL
jgi:uncharacterized protein (TIGR02001 family)